MSCMIPLIQNVQNGQIHGESRSVVSLGWGDWGTGALGVTVLLLGVMKCSQIDCEMNAQPCKYTKKHSTF